MNKFKLVPVEPTDDELIAWAGEEQFFLFCDKDDFLDIARSVLQRYAGRSPAVQGEPVAWVTVDTVDGQEVNGKPRRIWWENNEGVGMPIYAAPQPAVQQPALTKYQPCGCVICTCEHETQCQGCGANHCGTHPVGQIPKPAYQQPAPDVSKLVEALEQCITSMLDSGYRADAVVIRAARYALAAHRREPSHDNQ